MKIGIVGAWHVHTGDYTEIAKKYADVVGVYDGDAERRRNFADKAGIPEYADYDALLDACDSVIICTATNRHTEYIIKAANMKKRIFTEKVLALTDEECQRIKSAIIQNGVEFVISYPWKFRPEILAIKSVCDSKKLGRINYFRFRNCHNGSTAKWLPKHFYDREACGGGAMIDLGAHGMYLADWFLGEPKTYASAFTHFCDDEYTVEDNAVTVMGYENGAIAVNETGFVSYKCPVIMEVGGENGYAVFDGKSVTVRISGAENCQPELPPAPLKPIEAFVKGEKIEGCGIDDACRLTHMMVSSYK